MNIKTFENELNPEFIKKARNIFTLARIKNNKVEVNNNTFAFNSISNISNVTIDSNLNVKSTSCNCKSKFLYCEHTVATFFAIKEYLIKGNENKEINQSNEQNIYSFINNLDSISFYNPSKINIDLLKLLKIIANENNTLIYLEYFIKNLKTRYLDNKIIISNISLVIRQLNYNHILNLSKALKNNGFNLSILISNYLLNGLQEEIIISLFNDLFNELTLDILDNSSVTTLTSYNRIISNLNQDISIYYELLKLITNYKIDYYLINKFINSSPFNNNLIDKILYSFFKHDLKLELTNDEISLIINYGLKYGINLDHFFTNYLTNDDEILKLIPNITIYSLTNNKYLINKFLNTIKDNISILIDNDLNTNGHNTLLTTKNITNLLLAIPSINIFELDYNKYSIIFKDIINHLYSNDKYYKLYDKYHSIYFSTSNARIYLINNVVFEIKKYDYQLEPLAQFETEELILNNELDKCYINYLNDIKDLIPEINKEKKIKQLNNLQNYLLSSLITNENKYNLKLELTLNTNKKLIKKELFSLRLKIGINKYYYVNDIFSLFYNIKNNKTQTFGKNNIFDLNIDNFNDASKALIEELFPLVNNNSITKVLEINSTSLNKIFNVYHLEYIDFTYRNNIYSICILNEEVSPSINIDKNGVISSKELNKNSLIISGLNKDYLIDLNNLNIKKLNYKNNKIKNIVYFLIKNNNFFETNNIEDKFIETIYPLIYECSNVSEEFNNKNPIKLLEIHSYIDIDDFNVISVESKYYYDNQEIKELNIIQQEKVNNYLKLLSILGFDKNNLIKDSDLVGDFLKKDLSNLKDIAKVYISNDLKEKKLSTFNSYNVYLRKNNNMLNISFSQSEYNDDELYSILQAFKKKKRYAFLKGKVIEINEKKAKELLNIIDDFSLDEKHLSKEVNNPFFNILKIKNYYEITEFEIEEKLHNVLEDIFAYKEAKFKPNSELSRIMRPYQIEAFKWLKTLNKYNLGGVLADDMGLGKTLETIALLDNVKSDKPSIIISPKSLIYNWEKELEKWPTALKPFVIDGLKVDRMRILEDNYKKGIVFIISYDTLRNDLDFIQEKEFNYVILDEAQSIKNMQALKTKSVKKLKADYRLVLTGTPIENSVADLWSIFDFLMPNYLFNYERFRNEIEKGILMNDDEAYQRIILKTKPFILRRKKEDVLKDLPDKIEETISIRMNTDQRKIYDAFLLKTRQSLKSNDNKIQILSLLTKLRQICISPALVSDSFVESEKIQYATQMVNNLINTDHKVLIFSQFVSALELIEKELISMNIPYFIITGNTNSKKRLEMAEKFNQQNSNEKVFLISLKAGGTGLNLIGADTVIHLDPWWNVAIENQASDRAHRIGQQRKVTVFKLVMNNSIEEKVIELQNSKKEIADRIISNNDTDISNLLFDDYDYLLS